jgi:hypothetical protein
MVITVFNPNGHSMYLALQDFYPKVTPPGAFVGNLFEAFDQETATDMSNLATWATRLEKWLPVNVGLIRDPADGNWVHFRIVDNKLYTFALIRYS